MKLHAFNLTIGTTGTLAAIELTSLNSLAAIFAGFATGVWMITQITLNIMRYRRECSAKAKVESES